MFGHLSRATQLGGVRAQPPPQSLLLDPPEIHMQEGVLPFLSTCHLEVPPPVLPLRNLQKPPARSWGDPAGFPVQSSRPTLPRYSSRPVPTSSLLVPASASGSPCRSRAFPARPCICEHLLHARRNRTQPDPWPCTTHQTPNTHVRGGELVGVQEKS